MASSAKKNNQPKTAAKAPDKAKKVKPGAKAGQTTAPESKKAPKKTEQAKKTEKSGLKQTPQVVIEDVDDDILLESELEDPVEIDLEEPAKVSNEQNLPSPPANADLLQRYLWEVRRYPLLTREEETRLAQEYYNTGDSEAAAKLVTSNLRLVVKIAMEHQNYWSRNLLDLVQEGNLGLIQALKKFDPFRNIKFSYYASFWINAYILKYIMDNWRLVRLGTTQAQRKLFYNLNKEKEKLMRMGVAPESKLLSDRLGVSEQDVLDMEQRLGNWEVSLDAPVNDDSDTSQHNFLPDHDPSAEDALADDELRRTFREKLAQFETQLDDKEKIILHKRLLNEEPATLNELGQEFGVSRERVRQLQERMLKKMRQYLEDEIPDFANLFSGLAERD